MKLLYSPFTGSPTTVNSDAAKFRAFHSEALWLHDPWSGVRRSKEDLIVDPYGLKLRPPAEQLDAAFATELREFLAGDPGIFGRSKWFENHQLKVYARNHYTYLGLIEKDRYRTLSISNVEVFKRGLGLYKQILAIFEQQADAGSCAICIESVLDPSQHAIYERRGFQKFIPSVEDFKDMPFWFYKLPRL